LAALTTQLFRYDVVRQITPAGTDTWNYGFSKGFDLIPWHSTEVDVSLAPYIQHNSKAIDGFGDFSSVLKFRIASANLGNGAYSVAASLTTAFPTGSYKNGAALASRLFGSPRTQTHPLTVWTVADEDRVRR